MFGVLVFFYVMGCMFALIATPSEIDVRKGFAIVFFWPVFLAVLFVKGCIYLGIGFCEVLAAIVKG